MSDPLLPDGISIGPCLSLGEKEAVRIDLGKRFLAFGHCTIEMILEPRQAKAFASLILKQAMEIERHGLRLVRPATDEELRAQRDSWVRGEMAMGSDRDEAMECARMRGEEDGA